MNDFQHSSKRSVTPTPGAARVKLRRLAQIMRVLSAAYAAWVLWRIVDWWTNAELVKRGMGHYLKLDLSALAPSQRMAAMGVRREKAAFSCGLKPHPAKAPAGSNRSGHGGNDMAEAFG